MSGQQSQPNPWYAPGEPQQWQPGPPPYPPSGGGRRNGRRGGWLVVAVVTVVALLAGGTFAGLTVFGDSDESSSSADDPSSPSSEDPTRPSPTPATTGLWEAVPSDAEVNRVGDGLEASGYACYETAGPAMLTPDEPVVVDGQPLLVQRCYLDPATGRDEEQTVSLQAAPDGSVSAVRVTINAFLDNGSERTSDWFAAAVRGLTGTVLRPSEARELLAGRTPDIGWGRATLDTNPEGTSYRLELVAEGAEIATVPGASTQLSIQDVRAHYSGDGFACRDERRSVVCERSGRGYSLLAVASDPCHAATAGPECGSGHTVRNLTLNAEFDAGLPDQVYTDIFDDLFTGSLTFAYQDAWSPEIDAALGAVDFQEPHRLDVGGLHVEFLPGTTLTFDPAFDQAYQVVVEGVCSTDC